MVHSVYFHDKIRSEEHLNLCSRSNKQIPFSVQKYWPNKGST